MNYALLLSFLALVLTLIGLGLLILSATFLMGMFWGAPYAPTKPETVKKMMALAKIKAGQKAVDLGAGDGRLVVASALAGAIAVGYEINPWLVWRARCRIKKAGLNKNQARIYWQNFSDINFGDYDVITIYGLGSLLKKLEPKFLKELKPQARLVSNYFKFPSWKPAQTNHPAHLYIKK